MSSIPVSSCNDETLAIDVLIPDLMVACPAVLTWAMPFQDFESNTS